MNWREVQLELNRFYKRYSLPYTVQVDGKLGPATKAAVKDAKFLLGYTRAYVTWATGTNPVFLRRLKHPTFLMTRKAVARGIARRAARRTLKISHAGVDFIADFEGYYPNWYTDPVGVRTIGYGHTSEGLPSWAKPPLSQRTARALLDRDLDQYEAAVRRLVKVPLTQNQFDALVSFTYNVGVGALGSSTLLKKLNRRDYEGATRQFGAWVYGNPGQKLPGLVRRRAAEARLFTR